MGITYNRVFRYVVFLGTVVIKRMDKNDYKPCHRACRREYTERLYRTEATALINSLTRRLGPLEPMGSYRRMAWMIGDLDMITPDPMVI